MTPHAGTPGHSEYERRTHRRYPIELELQLMVPSGKRVYRSAEGKSVNISSTGMQFRSLMRVNIGDTMIVQAKWPVAAEGVQKVLFLYGQVVWKKGSVAGMAVSRYGLLSHLEISDPATLDNPYKLILPRRLTPTKIQS